MDSCGAEAVRFVAARPVWPEGREREMNLFVGFRAVVAPPAGALREPEQRVVLRVTAASAYRAFLNGRFVGWGPARAAHGYARVDEWDLSPLLRPGENLVAVEAVGYNVNSYYWPEQPAFVRAEVVAGGRVLAATGAHGFEAVFPGDHVQRVERYSAARTFSEVFRLTPGCHAWRTDPGASFVPAACAVFPETTLLPRRAPYPGFDVLRPARHVAAGRIGRVPMPGEPYRDWTLTEVGPHLKGYTEAELEAVPSLELQTVRLLDAAPLDRPFAESDVLALSEKTWHLLDLGLDRCGFVGFEVTCASPARLWLTFDELLTGGRVDARRARCVNVVACDVAAGAFAVETFEPYTLRYLTLLALGGACSVENVYLREVANPETGRARFEASDGRLNRVFEAARATFRPNAVDLFTDCPSRERAGWPCDSFFTSRAAFALTGNTTVERAFLENYLLAPPDPHLPPGMLPMNYPADHPNGLFIPNWPLWLVLQLEEYLARSGDRALVDAFAAKVRALFDYFRPFENTDGLLEGLQGWVFVEWSEANSFVQDVSYPTNMLYAAALDTAGRLYDEPAWTEQAEALRRAIRAQAFDGAFFVDRALRQGGRLVPAPDTTEVGQCYAFSFGGATPETHPDLWARVRDELGPRRNGRHPHVHPANLLNGHVLRLELLSCYGCAEQALEETAALFFPMAERTGTLWEHDAPSASCCHGFASHVAHSLYRDALGIERVDATGRMIHLRFVPNGLSSCSGTLPLDDGELTLNWHRDGDALRYRIGAPPGFTVHLENDTGCTLVRDDAPPLPQPL